MTAHQHRETCDMPMSAENMFDLVADIESYPEFLPWCSKVQIISREDSSEGEVIIADLTVGYGFFSDSFRSKVLLQKNIGKISVDYVSGPLQALQNIWEFEVLGSKECRVHFYINFELQGRMFQSFIARFFEIAFERMLTAFKERAYKIYT